MIRPLAFVFALVPSLASAANCWPRDAVVEQLADKYGERRVASGLTTRPTFVEFWANAETGSWTITETTPGGVTCLRGSGDNWTPETTTEPAGDPA